MEEADYQDMYIQFYEDILEQMSKQGFSKIAIQAQRIMYETREDLYKAFLDRYTFEEEPSTEIIFTPKE